MQKEFIAPQEIDISFKVPQNCKMKGRCQGTVWLEAGKGMQERGQKRRGGKREGRVAGQEGEKK